MSDWNTARRELNHALHAFVATHDVPLELLAEFVEAFEAGQSAGQFPMDAGPFTAAYTGGSVAVVRPLAATVQRIHGTRNGEAFETWELAYRGTVIECADEVEADAQAAKLNQSTCEHCAAFNERMP